MTLYPFPLGVSDTGRARQTGHLLDAREQDRDPINVRVRSTCSTASVIASSGVPSNTYERAQCLRVGPSLETAFPIGSVETTHQLHTSHLGHPAQFGTLSPATSL